MSQITTQVDTYQVTYKCDDCGLADMIIDPESISFSPFSYICPNCNSTMTSFTRYPQITYQNA